MKNLFFYSVILFAVSCQTNEVEQQRTSESIAQTTKLNKQKSLRVFYDDGGSNFGCAGTGGNCLADVIVTNPNRAYAEINDFINALNSSENTTFFNENKEFLLTLLSQKTFDLVMDGSLVVTGKKTNDDNTAYLLVRVISGGELFEVVPFKL